MQGRQRPPRPAANQGRVHLGASGVLQPLSEEFLYRSPEDPAAHASRWRHGPSAQNGQTRLSAVPLVNPDALE